MKKTESIKAIDEYIANQEERFQERLNLVRQAILEAIPNSKQCISWSMPTFYDKHNIIHFAQSKNHIGIYPGAKTVEDFSEKLKDYKTSKGAIQFPNDKEIDLELIKQIAVYSYESQK